MFDAFYWIINFGSFFASLLMPIFLKNNGASVAFAIPGVLMLIATVIFWSGRKKYVVVPPAPPNPDSFTRVARTALFRDGLAKAGTGTWLAVGGMVLSVLSLGLTWSLGFVSAFCLGLVALLALGGAGTWMQLDRARGRHPDEAVEGVRGVLRVMIVFALVTPFWSLFDQKASTWVLQADQMAKPSWFQSAQMQALNPALVMILIPFNNLVLFPIVRRFGWEPTALRRMTVGMVFTGVSWIVVSFMQLAIDGGTTLSIVWQVLPYALLTFGEVMVSATGLEFAYSQAPASMKGVLMSLWYLAVTIGNLWVLLANSGVRNASVIAAVGGTGLSVTAFLMFFFAGFALLAALAFGFYARVYKEVDHYRTA